MTLTGKLFPKEWPDTVGQVFEHSDRRTLASEAGAPT